MNTSNTDLQILKRQYLLRRVGELLLLATGAALLVCSILLYLGQVNWICWLGAGLAGLLLFTARYFQLGLHDLSEREIAIYLNRQFNQLEDSTDLLITPMEELRPIQQLQRQRLLKVIEQEVSKVNWPHQWPIALAILLAGLVSLGMARTWGDPVPVDAFHALEPVMGEMNSDSETLIPVELIDQTIRIQPPAYTGRPAYHSSAFDLEVPESSTVNWQLHFSGQPEAVKLVFSNGDSTLLKQADETFSISRSVRQSGYYSLQWMDRGELKTSDFYKLGVIEDQPPQVAVTNQQQFVELPWEAEIAITVNARMSDDYGLTEAYAIATVSKGSGESVKFREEKLPLTDPGRIGGKQLQASLRLNTQKLGMEPGDELYYYIQAWDNRTPQRQSSRTETFFIAIQDTSTQMISFEGGLGVDLMPEYFRSQRQIIIDSEKLLTERSSIQKKAFDNRSNDLAYGQKVLRLRYGQFLGEEFESGMTAQPEPETEAAPEGEEEVLEQYGHAHDTDNEHNLVAEEHDHEHEHEENPGSEEQEGSPIEAFAHSHDNMEEATFFIQSVKSKLRAALSMMWDAELHLRMNDPASSLPYQYKILKLLKEISQDSRIYVHRTGFDAPPLKEEKRLTGELEEITNPRSIYQSTANQIYPAIRRAAPRLEEMMRNLPASLTTADRELLAAAGNELAGAAIEQPDLYLERLSTLKQILDGELTTAKLRLIRKAFWRLLPDLPRAPGNVRVTDHPLQNAFIQQLKVRR